MQQRMGGVLTYCHEDGMNYNEILDDMIVGSCPQTVADVDRCKACDVKLQPSWSQLSGVQTDRCVPG